MKILVVGGTGPSGPHLVQGLLERGHEVTVLHRGVHEPPGQPEVPHIHADPHFAGTLGEALGAREFDAVYGLYGRLETLARFFARRCGRFIGVGGRAVYAGYIDPASSRPRGARILADEDSPRADPAAIADPKQRRFVEKSLAAEDAVLEMHAQGAYRATLMRYTYVYGPRALAPVEWSIYKRLADGRPAINLPCGGLVTYSRCAAKNAARYLLLALERDEAAGRIFNCADETQYSLRQWVELFAEACGAPIGVVDVPEALRWTVAHFLLYAGTAADLALQDIARARALLGYCDAVGPHEAVAETVEAYRRDPVDWRAIPGYSDRFDYALEDEVREALAALTARFEPRRRDHAFVHTYAHPKAPTVQVDEKGR